MIKRQFKKIFSFVCILLILLFFNSNKGYCFWLTSDVFDGIAWINDDLSFPVNEWYLIDDNNNGVANYYYFDEHGMVLTDTIAPDYRIVNEKGQRLLLNGDIEDVIVSNNQSEINDQLNEANDDLQDEIQKNSAFSLISSGTIDNGLIDWEAIKQQEEESNALVTKKTDEKSGVILGENVKIIEEKQYYDATIDKKAVSHVSASSNFSKKVNGTIFNKSKWKEVMALKGNDSYVDFTNQSNNFNRIRGRVATHYFTYTDRTIICTLNVYANGEDIETINGFNYNSGVSFDILFPKKTNTIRFELIVDEQYTTLIVYLKDVRFGFNKAAYKDELEEDEEDAAFESLMREMDPNYVAPNEIVDEDDEGTSSEEKDEEETVDEEETIVEDKTSGPSFDKVLNATRSTSGPIGPLGEEIRIIPGK